MATGLTMIALLSPLHFTLHQLLIFFSLADIRADNYLRCLSTGKRQPKWTLRKRESTQRPNLQWPPDSFSQGGVGNGLLCMYQVCLVSKEWRGQGNNGEAEVSWIFLPQSWQTLQVPVLHPLTWGRVKRKFSLWHMGPQLILALLEGLERGMMVSFLVLCDSRVFHLSSSYSQMWSCGHSQGL